MVFAKGNFYVKVERLDMRALMEIVLPFSGLGSVLVKSHDEREGWRK